MASAMKFYAHIDQVHFVLDYQCRQVATR